MANSTLNQIKCPITAGNKAYTGIASAFKVGEMEVIVVGRDEGDIRLAADRMGVTNPQLSLCVDVIVCKKPAIPTRKPKLSLVKEQE